jgi:pyrroline-5-carboxylate reductase
MPNTPGRHRPRHHRRGRQRARLERAARARHTLLSAVGAVEWAPDEALMDAVTALSGSGRPMFPAGRGDGAAASPPGCRPRSPRRSRARTVAGSGELLHRSPLDAATLRQNVTSPGGTTAAALDVLMAQDGLEPLMTKAIAAATKRSRDLAG